MSVNKTFSVSYEDIFKREPVITVSKLLEGIPSKTVMMIIADAAAQVHMAERDNMRQVKLLVKWTGRIPHVYQDRLQRYVDQIATFPETRFNFINNTSLLILTQHVLMQWNDLDMVDNLTPDEELRVFKSYLLCTHEWITKQATVKQDFETTEGLLRTIIPLKFPYDEIIANKDFRLQFLKATFFFRFCEAHPIFSNYIRIFLKEHNVSSWFDYASNFLGIYIRKFDELKVSSVLVIKDEHKSVQEFLRQFCIDTNNFTANHDFTQIREKPVIELRKNEFLFINLNFLVDKFFQGIQFSLFKALKQNKTEYKGKRIEKFDHYKSIYGEEISEKGLFYSIFDYTFDKPDVIKLRGEEMKAYLRDGEPDYYLRDKNSIFLFEYKDVLINGDTKHSYDYNRIHDEIFNKLVSNKDASPKGVTQLVNTLEKLSGGDFQDLDEYEENQISIFPVLVVTEFVLTLPGVNYLLNNEFKRQLKTKGIQNPKVRDLVVIDLNTFLRFHQQIRQGKLNLGEYIDRFIQFTKTKINLSMPLLTFDGYINDNYKLPIDYKPDILMREIKGMIKE